MLVYRRRQMKHRTSLYEVPIKSYSNSKLNLTERKTFYYIHDTRGKDYLSVSFGQFPKVQ